MKNPGAPERRRLVVLLEAALLREARLWKAPVFKNGSIQVRRCGHLSIKRCDLVADRGLLLLPLRAQTSLRRSTEK